MKKIFRLCLLVASFPVSCLFAQGKFAGSYRALLGKTYQDKTQLPLLSGFTLQGGTFIGDLSASCYRKGNLAIALFETISKNGYTVRDVLQLSNFSDNQSLRFGNCLNRRAIDDESIVALVTVGKGELLQAVSAWRWNDEVKGLESIDKNDANGMSCPQEQLSFSQLASPRWKPFINKVYKDSKDIPALKDYTLREGTMLSDNIVGVSSFAKGNNVVLVFERTMEGNSKFVFEIVETTLNEGQDIRVGLCRKGNVDDAGIIAVVNTSTKERWQAAKAWVCDMYHLAVTETPAKEITCLGNYGEN